MAKKKKAKKKIEKTEEILIPNLDDILKGMEKEFGEGIFVAGNDIISRNRQVISFSPKMDLMLGGGIPEGNILICTGPPKVGKTTGCLHFAGMAQRPEYDHPKHGPRHVFFHNVEMRLKDRDLEGIQHLITDGTRFTSIESKPGNILTAEKHARIFERLVHQVPGAIFVFDSFSALCTETRLNSELGNKFRDNQGSILSDMLIRTQPVILMNDAIVLGVTHIVANTSGFGSNKSETAGVKIQYHSDIKLRATHRTAWKVGGTKEKDGTQVGQHVHWNCDWSAIGPPGTKCESLLRYGYGIDKESEMIEVCSDLGLINKAGSWLTFPDGTKVQGLENAREVLAADPELYSDLNKQFREMMGFVDESDRPVGKDNKLEA